MQDVMQIVLVVLSIGVIVGPILHGFVTLKMMDRFETKESALQNRTLADTQRNYLIDGQQRLERNQKEMADKLDLFIEDMNEWRIKREGRH